jgi:hypothetical protein
MNEREPTPEAILRLKDAILTGFRALPAEHQATMGLVILNAIIEGEWGEWMKEAIATRWPAELVRDRCAFPITSLSREDLRQVNLSDDELAQLTDDDLQQIARMMEDHYVKDWFWDELEFNARKVLEKKKKR